MIQRGRRATDNFTIISNDHVRDERLSWAARGLLAWLCSHAEGYDITEGAIVAAGPMKRDGIRTLLRELEGLGYLRRDRRSVIEGGSTVDYILTDPTLARVGESDPRADQGKQGQANSESAGQATRSPRVGESDPRSYPENQEKTKTPSVSKRATATRVPDDFQPTDDLRAWFVAEQLGAVIDGKLEHEKFMDYWRAASGANARKHDWPATWRNWMRRAAERAPRRPGTAVALPPSGRPSPNDPTGVSYRPGQSTTDDRVMQGLALVQQFRLEEENKA